MRFAFLCLLAAALTISVAQPNFRRVTALDSELSGGLFRAEYAAFNQMCDVHSRDGTPTYWIGNNPANGPSPLNQRLLLDLGTVQPFSRVLLKNSNNGGDNN